MHTVLVGGGGIIANNSRSIAKKMLVIANVIQLLDKITALLTKYKWEIIFAVIYQRPIL